MGEFHSWGKIMVLNGTDTYTCREITVYAGQRFDLAEYVGANLDGRWHCVSGRGTITIPSEKRAIHLYDNDLNLREFRSLDSAEELYLLCWQHSDIVIVEVIRKSHGT
jgi:hypothetical protein